MLNIETQNGYIVDLVLEKTRTNVINDEFVILFTFKLRLYNFIKYCSILMPQLSEICRYCIVKTFPR